MATLLPDRCEPARKLFIAVPSYTGTVSMETNNLWMEGGLRVLASGMALTSYIMAFDPYVDRCRNELVTEFLTSDATDILFIDSDVGGQPDAIIKIATARRPFVAGFYPMKRWAVEGSPEFALKTPDRYEVDEEGLFTFDDVVPTGFLRLNREVFEHMPYKVYEIKGKRQLGFFKTEIAGSDTYVGLHHAKMVDQPGRYTGEDVGFCLEWLRRGGHIRIMPNLTLSHLGPARWEANLHRVLSSKTA